MVDRVGDAGVLGLRTVIKIDGAVSPYHDVFQQRIAADRVIDIRLVGFRQLNGLRVAAAFEVKYAVIIPSVLVIANQAAFRVGGEGGFTGAGEAEEHGDIAFSPTLAEQCIEAMPCSGSR